jgi:hypothetical protein
MVYIDTIFDKPVKSHNSDGKVKSSSSRRREFRVMRRTYRTPQSQRDEAQRRNRTFYEAVIFLYDYFHLYLSEFR